MATREDLLQEADDYLAAAAQARFSGDTDRADDQTSYAQQLQAEAEAAAAPAGWDKVDAGLDYDAAAHKTAEQDGDEA